MSGMQPPQWPPWAPQGRAARLRWQIRTWSHRTRMRAVFWWRREVRWRWRPTCSLCGGRLEPGEIAEPGSPYPYRCPECGGQCTGWFATDGTEYCDDNDDAWGRQPWEPGCEDPCAVWAEQSPQRCGWPDAYTWEAGPDGEAGS